MIRDHYRRGDFAGAAEITHKLAGSVNSVAHSELGIILSGLEARLREGDKLPIESKLQQAESLLLSLNDSIDQVLASTHMPPRST